MKNEEKKLNYGADLKWATTHLYCKTRFVLQYEVAGLRSFVLQWGGDCIARSGWIVLQPGGKLYCRGCIILQLRCSGWVVLQEETEIVLQVLYCREGELTNCVAIH